MRRLFPMVALAQHLKHADTLSGILSENVSDSQERSVAQFRIRQLTGLDQLERRYFLD